MVEIRPATMKDAHEYWGGNPPMRSMRGFVAVLDGRVIGIAGVYYDGRAQVAFSEIKEEMKAHKKDIVRGTRRVMAMIRERGLAVWATCGDERSARFVERCGFKPGPLLNGKKVMIWNGSH